MRIYFSVLSTDMVFIEENCMTALADMMSYIFAEAILLAFQLRFQRLKPSGIKILICAPAREFLVGPLSHMGEAVKALVLIVRRVNQGDRNRVRYPDLSEFVGCGPLPGAQDHLRWRAEPDPGGCAVGQFHPGGG